MTLKAQRHRREFHRKKCLFDVRRVFQRKKLFGFLKGIVCSSRKEKFPFAAEENLISVEDFYENKSFADTFLPLLAQ